MYVSENYIAIPPGATIKEQLETRGMTQKEFAARMGMTEKHISNLINGRVELNANVANRLESVLGLPARFWLNLESLYREDLVKVQDELEMESEIKIVKKMPYSEMAKLGWVEKTRVIEEKVRNLRRFFEVAKLTIFEELRVPGIAFRVKETSEQNAYALAAWAQRAKVASRVIQTKDINIQKLRDNLQTIRALTQKQPSEFQMTLQDIMSDCGIAIVFLPHLSRSYLHGASFYDGKRIVLGLTVRGKSADIFWFSLFHELYHIIEGHIDISVETTQEDEEEADLFAKNILIPPEAYNRFIKAGNWTKEAICSYSKEIGIAPGILLGRLQKENIVPYNVNNELKEKYEISVS